MAPRHHDVLIRRSSSGIYANSNLYPGYDVPTFAAAARCKSKWSLDDMLPPLIQPWKTPSVADRRISLSNCTSIWSKSQRGATEYESLTRPRACYAHVAQDDETREVMSQMLHLVFTVL